MFVLATVFRKKEMWFKTVFKYIYVSVVPTKQETKVPQPTNITMKYVKKSFIKGKVQEM
jgi:hypothetical protein